MSDQAPLAGIKTSLDSDSAIPLYHQIVQAIRYAVGTGELTPGSRLPSLRGAAAEWGVSLHTVRRAYQELEKEGLVATRVPDGTRVRAARSGISSTEGESLDEFARLMLARARSRFGVGALGLVQALRRLGDVDEERPKVWVVECSPLLCESLAGQIRRRWWVDARRWDLERIEQVPEGVVVGTYFHYNEIRERLGARVRDARFLTVRPDTDELVTAWRASRQAQSEGEHGGIVLCETDEAMAHSIVADLQAALPPEAPPLQVEIPEQPTELLGSGAALLLFSPRSYQQLSEEQRADHRVRELHYVIDAEDLRRLGTSLGWIAAGRASDTGTGT